MSVLVAVGLCIPIGADLRHCPQRIPYIIKIQTFHVGITANRNGKFEHIIARQESIPFCKCKRRHGSVLVFYRNCLKKTDTPLSVYRFFFYIKELI